MKPKDLIKNFGVNNRVKVTGKDSTRTECHLCHQTGGCSVLWFGLIKIGELCHVILFGLKVVVKVEKNEKYCNRERETH